MCTREGNRRASKKKLGGKTSLLTWEMCLTSLALCTCLWFSAKGSHFERGLLLVLNYFLTQ